MRDNTPKVTAAFMPGFAKRLALALHDDGHICFQRAWAAAITPLLPRDIFIDMAVTRIPGTRNCCFHITAADAPIDKVTGSRRKRFSDNTVSDERYTNYGTI